METIKSNTMKNFILLLLISVTFLGCSKDDNNTTTPPDDSLSTSPEAKEQYDADSYGVYKGIFTGSSGTIYVNINNSGSVSAKFVIDGTKYNFTTSESVTSGQAISGLTFSNGSSSFDFNVGSQGENPIIDNINISGHPYADVQVFKEYSYAHIKCYLGTFNGDDSGTFNMATASDGYALGLAKPAGQLGALYLDGTLDGNTITGTFEGGSFTGTISGNNISGTWQNTASESGNWTGTRKL
jgi:hypothetical protein